MYLGIELGSTRIKAVVIDDNHKLVESGGFSWENSLVDGIWTYSLDDVWTGLKSAVKDLKNLGNVKSIGISAMMHGYLVFDKAGNQLANFRTWRNSTTEEAAKILSKEFNFNIPLRWNIAHLYQAILNKEQHIENIDFLTTLAGYVHWKLTGKKVVGVGDASGIFPCSGIGYNNSMVIKFDKLAEAMPWKLADILPTVLNAGENAGQLTEEGAKLLGGVLKAGTPFCPPEGDAGTGMVATNSVKVRTGNVSAGTSVFAMIVLEHELSKAYEEIDMVTTPSGLPVAMVHANNCCSDIDAWVRLFKETLEAFGQKPDMNELYNKLYQAALLGDDDCGGVLTYNFISGEPIVGLTEGRPMLVRKPDSKFTLPNVMRSLVFSAIGTLKLGMDILSREAVALDKLLGHGGFFKVPEVGQKAVATALNTPVSVMESAGEGGAWGIAILAAFMSNKGTGEPLENYLENKVFAGNKGVTIEPNPQDVQGFNNYMEQYVSGLSIEKLAVEKYN